MTYCTLEDIKGIVPEQDLIELTDDMIPAETIIAANVDKAIADAGEMIDGYMRARYSLPLTPAPGMINTLACDIAVYRLYARRVKLTPPEGVSERYKNALKLLGQIQKCEISLGAGSSPTSEVSNDSVSVSAADRLFTRKTMEKY
jgi:phage gp36-like protein